MKSFAVPLFALSILNAFGQGGPPPLAPLAAPPAPAGNPVTAAKVMLGKALFWDEQLSSTRSVACGTCHRPATGGSDPRSAPGAALAVNPGPDGLFGNADDVIGSPGVPATGRDGTHTLSAVYGYLEQVTGRKAPSTVNAGYSDTLFWDGRATPVLTDPLTGAVVLTNRAALESQALGPPVADAEMAHGGRTWTDVVTRVAAATPLALSPDVPSALSGWINGRGYPQLFAEAFGSTHITASRIAMAIATYERSQFSAQTPLDAQLAGANVLTPAENAGFALFGQKGCAVCHATTVFSDHRFHYTGVRPPAEDPGRFAVTGNNADRGAFRTPGLRNVALHAPYMHNGRFATLEDVVEFYNRGGDFNAPNKDPLMVPLNLTAAEKSNLVAFLRRPLTDPRVAAETAPFDRPKLFSESSRVPRHEGAAVAGAGGFAPRIFAFAPPVAGHPAFAVGVTGALGGAQAVLVLDTQDPGAGPSVPASAAVCRTNLTLAGAGAGAGHASVALAIPTNAALVGTNLFARWFVYDAGAGGGVAASPLLRLRIFRDGARTGAGYVVDAQGRPAIAFEGTLRSAPDAGGPYQDEWDLTSPAPLGDGGSRRFFHAW